MGRFPHLGRFEGLKRADEEIAEEAMRFTDVLDFKTRRVNQ